MEATIFVVFLGLQIVVKAMPKAWEHVAQFAIVQRISQNHWIVWIFHPTVLHGIHDYAIHFFIYSGYVIHSH
jgi:hypothetical protein